MTDELRPVQLTADGTALVLLDQRALPTREVWLEFRELEPIAEAIEDLVVRGAPAIGCTAAYGLFVLSRSWSDSDFDAAFAAAAHRLAHTRPTAVNLFVAIEEMRAAVATGTVAEKRAALEQAARGHVERDLGFCKQMGENGASLLPAGGILTHCNTGALATAGYGTALGVIRSAHARGTAIHVFADETRPVLQGARLTVWELMRDQIPVTAICDNMAGALMAKGKVQAAIVGADRIARNGDVANKIGTYTVAVLCKHHGIPFYVAAPWTTIDLSLATGAEIEIEQRSPDEVRRHGEELKTPADAPVDNPAFDVTPAELVTAIVTEKGVHKPSELADLGG